MAVPSSGPSSGSPPPAVPLLVIGNRNYSSWSLRPGLALSMTGTPFDTVRIPLYQPGSTARIREYSAAGKVPVLVDAELVVWDSLAICEYLAERFPSAGLWPADRRARAEARSASNEMHSGFAALRRELPMNIRLDRDGHRWSPEAQADIDRVLQLWSGLRSRHGGGGPFLCGAFSIADAMYAPVVLRLRSYRAPVPDGIARYMQSVVDLPPMQAWIAAAHAEPERLEQFER
ncbi:MAG: glutathione S-transferase family protein [bacterium]